MTITDREIRNHIRAIKCRPRPVVLMLSSEGRIGRYDAGSGMHQRAVDLGQDWVGTYDRQTTPEMIADDLEASGMEVSP